MDRRKPEAIIDYRGHSLVIYKEKTGRVIYWGNRPYIKIADARAAIDELENVRTKRYASVSGSPLSLEDLKAHLKEIKKG